MLDLSAAAKLEKNSIASSGAWLLLLTLSIEGESPVRIVRNREDVVWPSGGGGNTFTAFAFEVDPISETGAGKIPSLVIRLGNATRVFEPFIQEYNGFIDAEILLQVVHSDHLDEPAAEVTHYFQVTGTSTDANWVAMEVGAVNPLTKEFPLNDFVPNFCNHKFKKSACKYAGLDAACDKTIADCTSKSNIVNFGGSPGMSGGIYVGEPTS